MPWLVVGYASLDRVVSVSRVAGPGETARLESPLDGTTRYGGTGPRIAMALARQGIPVNLVTWLGGDEDGRAFAAHLRATGVGVEHVPRPVGARTPVSFLLCADGGEPACYYWAGAGDSDREGATEAALAAARAGRLVLSVAPRPVTETLLDTALAAGVPVAWSVKADPVAYPAELVARIVRWADVVVLNRGEVAFVAAALGSDDPRLWAAPRAIVAVTDGPRALHLYRDGQTVEVSLAGARAGPGVGAGDVFAAHLLVGVDRGQHVVGAAAEAAEAARAWLEAEYADPAQSSTAADPRPGGAMG